MNWSLQHRHLVYGQATCRWVLLVGLFVAVAITKARAAEPGSADDDRNERRRVQLLEQMKKRADETSVRYQKKRCTPKHQRSYLPPSEHNT